MNFIKTTLTIAFALFYQLAFSQKIYIEGPQNICVGACAPYFMNTDQGPFLNAKIDVLGPDNSCAQYTDFNEASAYQICFGCPGLYKILLFGNGGIADSLNVFVNTVLPTIIRPVDTDSCSIEGSRAVCAGTTHTYEIANLQTTNAVEWSVSNAKSYTPNGNSVTVTWGDSGVGTINAFTFSIDSLNLGCGTEGSYSVKILKELDIDFNTNGNVFCVGETINPDPTITDVSYYEWDFGNGEKSNDIKPEISYDTPGNYTISLLVKNECGCTGTITKEITIRDKYKPVIDCKSTICENTEITYTTSADCGTFIWKVIGDGKITAGGQSSDKSITIDWGTGPQGLIELEVQACNFDLCPEKATFEIPIISDNAEISGEVVACNGALEYYSIQKYGATSYDWSVDGGTIVSGQGSSGIIVNWTAIDKGKINVKYDNCYLKCGGEDALDVLIKPSYTLSVAAKELCQGDALIANTTSSSNLPVIVSNWTIKDALGNVLLNETNKSNINFTIPANVTSLTVTTSSGDLCNGLQSILVNVLPKSQAPKGIKGETAICQSNEYVYEVDKNLANASFFWTINDGGTIKNNTGDKIIVKWNSAGPYSLQVQQTDLSANYCLSNAYGINPQKLTSISLNGNAESCIYDEYSLTATKYEGLDYVWKIIPSDAATIIETNESNVKLKWNAAGSHTIQLSSCAGTFTKTVTVNALPIITVNHALVQCENVASTVSTSVSYTSYNWKNKDGITLANNPTPSLLAGTYICEATDAKGCKNVESFTIKALPLPNIFLSTPDETYICLSDPNVTYPKLYALDAEDGYKYDWYQNGTSIGITTNTYQTSSLGKYTVEVTDAYGCKNTSNIVSVNDLCDPTGGGGGGGGGGNNCNSTIGTVDFSSVSLDCNTVSFTSSTSSIIAASEQWSFDDVASGINNFAIGQVVQHDFYNAGFYKVVHTVQVNDSNNPGATCYKYITKPVEVPISANFNYINACQGETIEFFDRSTFIPGRTITSWTWDFDDPASGSNNTSNLPDPTHVFANDGTYNVKLTISDGSCTDVFILPVTLHPKLQPSILDSIARCEKETSGLYLSDLKDVLNVNWDFGDSASGDANLQQSITGYHNYANSGTYNIKASIKSIYNCPSEVSRSLTIEANTLSGDINSSFGTVLCEGKSTSLSVYTSAVAWQWSTNETTNGIDVKSTGIYQVTVTDAFGCNYTPNKIQIKFNPLPLTSLVSTMTQEETVIKDYDTDISFCQGFDLSMQATQNSNWTYKWNGEAPSSISTYNVGQPLVGDYFFTLVILDNITGCKNTITPIKVAVNGLPDNIAIQANSTGILCENINHTLNVLSPNAAFKYTWSTGKKGTSINASAAGNYYAIGKDEKGCEGKSNVIEILPGPDYTMVPSGCFERCAPDSICFPAISNVTNYQWYKDGTKIDASFGGNVPYPIFTQSGSYYVEMVGSNGCTSKSEPLNLTLKQAFGVVTGKVYIDKNQNGLIDPLDSLVKNITVNLNANATTTNANGVYIFDPVPAGSYTVRVDVSLLPGYTGILNNLLAKVRTCDDTARADILLGLNCPPSFANTKHILCTEKEIVIGTEKFVSDAIYKQIKLNAFGCKDTIVHEIKFARKLEYKLSKQPSCENSANGAVTIENTGTNKFEAKVDNITLLNNTASGMSKGLHNLLLTDDIGCTTESTFEIVAKEVVAFSIKSEDISCTKGFADISLQLQNYKANEVTIKWSTGSSDEAIKIEKSGALKVSVDNGCGAITQTVEIAAEKGQNTLKKYVVCSGVSLDLLGQKFDSDTTFAFTTQTGTCTDTTSYDLQFSPRFDYELKTEGNCKNEDNGKIYLNMKSPGYFTYTLGSEVVNFDSGLIDNLPPKKYQLKIKDDIGCEQTETIYIESKESVEYDIINEGITCFKGYAEVGLDIVNYNADELKIQWSNNANTALTEIGTAGTYTVTVDNGCESISETIEVTTSDKRPDFTLPNALAPDGGNINAQIDLNNTEFKQAEIKAFKIFDRSGMMVFQSQANNKVWDGTANGRLLTSGVYVYTIEANVDICGKQETIKKAGTITLVR